MRLGSVNPSSTFGKTKPPPFFPGTGTAGRLVKSISEWQPKHCSTLSTRYLPRAIRSGVRGIVSISRTDAVGFAAETTVVFELVLQTKTRKSATTHAGIRRKILFRSLMHAPGWLD